MLQNIALNWREMSAYVSPSVIFSPAARPSLSEEERLIPRPHMPDDELNSLEFLALRVEKTIVDLNELSEVTSELIGNCEYVYEARHEDFPKKANCITIIHCVLNVLAEFSHGRYNNLSINPVFINDIQEAPDTYIKQFRWQLRNVKVKDLRPCDLVFVSRRRDTPFAGSNEFLLEKEIYPCHVALYHGDGKFFHCSYNSELVEKNGTLKKMAELTSAARFFSLYKPFSTDTQHFLLEHSSSNIYPALNLKGLNQIANAESRSGDTTEDDWSDSMGPLSSSSSSNSPSYNSLDGVCTTAPFLGSDARSWIASADIPPLFLDSERAPSPEIGSEERKFFLEDEYESQSNIPHPNTSLLLTPTRGYYIPILGTEEYSAFDSGDSASSKVSQEVNNLQNQFRFPSIESTRKLNFQQVFSSNTDSEIDSNSGKSQVEVSSPKNVFLAHNSSAVFPALSPNLASIESSSRDTAEDVPRNSIEPSSVLCTPLSFSSFDSLNEANIAVSSLDSATGSKYTNHEVSSLVSDQVRVPLLPERKGKKNNGSADRIVNGVYQFGRVVFSLFSSK
jgi:hypothetical protein